MTPSTSSGRSVASAWVLALLRPVGVFAGTLLGATLLAQVLLALAPGNPADILAGDPDLREAMVEAWGLDRPLLVRWWVFVAGMSRGELGTSLTYRPGMQVTALVLPAAGRSLALTGGALVTCLGLGTLLAFGTAGRRSGVGRRLVQLASVGPTFLLAWAAMHGLNETAWSLVQAGVIERPGWFALPDQDSVFKRLLAVAVLAVGSSALAEVHASVEASLQRIRRSGYVDAARARRGALVPLVLRNLVPDLAAVGASRAAFFVGGLVVVETVLQVNGVGSMLWQACRLRDAPVALGITVVAAAVVALARLLGDVVRVVVDPRLRAA